VVALTAVGVVPGQLCATVISEHAVGSNKLKLIFFKGWHRRWYLVDMCGKRMLVLKG
jgi:hypothetical protein